MNIVFIAGVAEKVRAWFSGWFGAVLSIIPKTMYFLCTLIFQILDILQLLVRKVAGLDVVYYTNQVIQPSGPGANVIDDEAVDGDIVYTFLKSIFSGSNSILSNVFWAMIILGVIMLFLTTLIAVLRSEYAATDSQSASKSKIVVRAFKAMASFAVVPIVCFFGVFLANVILQALDTITSGSSASELGFSYEEGEITQNVSNLFHPYTTKNGQTTYITYNFWGTDENSSTPTTSTPISGLIFKAAAYKANRIRYYSIFREHLSNPDVSANVFNKFGTDYDSSANLLDECFANSYMLTQSADLTTEPFKDDYLFPFGNPSSFISNSVSEFSSFDKNKVSLVWYYYDLWSFDFILCIAALVICAKLLVYLVFGLMKRIFEVVVLFLISPPIAALMPIDEGAALKKWREKFLSKVIGAYAPIVGMNLFFILLPMITTIKFFNNPFVDAIVNMFFVIVGLIMVKDLVGTISEIIGGENAMESGSKMASEVGDTVGKVGKLAVAPAGFAVKTAKFGIKAATGLREKTQDKNVKDKYNEANASPDAKAAMSVMTGGEKRRYLRGLRNNMSEEQAAEAHAKFDTTTGATQSGSKHLQKRQEKREEKEQEGINDLRYRISAMNSSGGAGKWQSMSRKEKKNKTQEQRESDTEPKSYEGRASKYKSQINHFGAELAKETANKETLQTDIKDLQSRKDGLSGASGLSSTERKRMSAEYDSKISTKRGEIKASELKEAELKQKQDESIKHYNGNELTAKSYKMISAGGILKGLGLSDSGMAKAGKELAKAFGDNLTAVMSALGGSMAKGFKEAGGWSEIGQRMLGATAKEVAISAETKNQKKIYAAQEKANQLLGKSSEGPQKINLSDESIKKLAETISKSHSPK